MSFDITVTTENTKAFPMHSHNVWELMCYIESDGFLHTKNKDYAFSPGTVIAVPPGMSHGSVSKKPFVNICIHTDIYMHDNKIHYLYQGTEQIKQLFEIIRNLWFSNEKYENVIMSLINALKELIAADIKYDALNLQIKGVFDIISAEFSDKEFDLRSCIDATGYTDDYFRTVFSKQYGITPKAYLNKLRMEYAASLINTYKNVIKIYEIASWCGFSDQLYFSRRFKNYFGISPQEYMRGVIKNEKT